MEGFQLFGRHSKEQSTGFLPPDAIIPGFFLGHGHGWLETKPPQEDVEISLWKIVSFECARPRSGEN